MARLRWAAALAIVVSALSVAPAEAAPTSAYGGQAEQSLGTGSAGFGLPGGSAGIRGGDHSGNGGLPFSAFDLLLIIGGSGLILISGVGFGRLLAERQRIGHP
jgi:hypothetical protein